MSETQGMEQRHIEDKPWREDPVILERLVTVERLYRRGKSIRAIAAVVEVSPTTVFRDIERLKELWLERAGQAVESIRAEVLATLAHVEQLALEAAEFDKQTERDLIYGDGEDAHLIHGNAEVEVKGQFVSAKLPNFHGNKAAAMNVARQAAMDRAKVAGILIDKAEVKGDHVIRQYVGVDVDAL